MRIKDFRLLLFDNAFCIFVQFAILENPDLKISTLEKKYSSFLLTKSGSWIKSSEREFHQLYFFEL